MVEFECCPKIFRGYYVRLRGFFFGLSRKDGARKKFFLDIETGRYQQNLGIENGRYQHILVSKQVSVSADTNVQSIGIGIELKILVSSNTTWK